ncbi:hypothetical protein ACFUJT_08365 [Streptomyces griseoincarnatus]
MSFPGSAHLPPVGAEVSCSGYSVNVVAHIEGLGATHLDLRGGIRFRVEGHTRSGLGEAKLRIIGQEFGGEHSALGRITLSQADTGTTPLTLLQLARNDPPAFRMSLFQDVILTTEKGPNGTGPLNLYSSKTMIHLADTLADFPPRGGICQLQEQVGFASASAPGKVIATIKEFPLTLSH